MNKKSIVFVILVVAPITLVFGLLLASRSFVDDQDSPCGIDDITRQQLLATAVIAEMKPEQELEMLGQHMAQQLKATGRTQLLPFYMPVARTVKKPKRGLRARPARKQPTIRPASAHAHWQRLKQAPIFRWPVNPAKFWISSYFGPRVLKGKKGFHQGIDMAAAQGTPVIAGASGFVKEAQYSPGYGNYILIVHPDGFKTRYAHLSRIRVKRNQRVRSGQRIGDVGATGKVTKSRWGTSASHLHFEVYKDGKRVNPFRYLA